jgi:hypothetical protein
VEGRLALDKIHPALGIPARLELYGRVGSQKPDVHLGGLLPKHNFGLMKSSGQRSALHPKLHATPGFRVFEKEQRLTGAGSRIRAVGPDQEDTGEQ